MWWWWLWWWYTTSIGYTFKEYRITIKIEIRIIKRITREDKLVEFDDSEKCKQCEAEPLHGAHHTKHNYIWQFTSFPTV